MRAARPREEKVIQKIIESFGRHRAASIIYFFFVWLVVWKKATSLLRDKPFILFFVLF